MIHRDIYLLYTGLHYLAETRTLKGACRCSDQSVTINWVQVERFSHQKLAVNREVAWYELHRIVMRSRSRLFIVEDIGWEDSKVWKNTMDTKTQVDWRIRP